jgi:hypothetical protein
MAFFRPLVMTQELRAERMHHKALESKRKGDRFAGSPYPVGSSVNRGCHPPSSRRKRFNLGALGTVDMVPAR